MRIAGVDRVDQKAQAAEVTAVWGEDEAREGSELGLIGFLGESGPLVDLVAAKNVGEIDVELRDHGVEQRLVEPDDHSAADPAVTAEVPVKAGDLFDRGIDARSDMKKMEVVGGNQ